MEKRYEGIVLRSDYIALQAAIREALDGWSTYSKLYFGTAANIDEDRIAVLRAQFLDDK